MFKSNISNTNLNFLCQKTSYIYFTFALTQFIFGIELLILMKYLLSIISDTLLYGLFKKHKFVEFNHKSQSMFHQMTSNYEYSHMDHPWYL